MSASRWSPIRTNGAHSGARRACRARAPRPTGATALASHDLDAVVVTLPTALHGAAALAAIARGVAMYLEKPLASTLDEATAVREAWRGHRR